MEGPLAWMQPMTIERRVVPPKRVSGDGRHEREKAETWRREGEERKRETVIWGVGPATLGVAILADFVFFLLSLRMDFLRRFRRSRLVLFVAAVHAVTRWRSRKEAGRMRVAVFGDERSPGDGLELRREQLTTAVPSLLQTLGGHQPDLLLLLKCVKII